MSPMVQTTTLAVVSVRVSTRTAMPLERVGDGGDQGGE